ncbi:MAG: Hpt domain-containing protein [Kofleriaceae bacterium]
MSEFEIDDVRELFAADMQRFTDDLGRHADMLRASLLEVAGHTAKLEGAIDAAAVAFHAIAGTSSLLGIQSVRTVAQRLESVSNTLAERTREIIARRIELEALAHACEVGNVGLREIITCELGKERSRAIQRSTELIREIERTAAPTATVKPPLGAEQAELLEVFRGELSQALSEVRTLLDALERGSQADRAAALPRIAALLHMAKGAAASVGATATEIELRNAYDITEDFLERGELPDPAQVRRLRDDLVALAPADDVCDKEEETNTDEISAQDLFRDEARELLVQARALLDEHPQGVGELARIFHRIKGSALVVELPEIAAEATAIEISAQRGEPVDTAVSRLSVLISGGAAPVGALLRVPVPDLVTGELWDSFLEESQELLDAIERLLRDLDGRSDADPVLTGLLGAFHTLKGAANTVGLTPAGKEFHVVETLLEQLQVDSSEQRRRHGTRVLVEVVARFRKNLDLARTSRQVDDATAIVEAEVAKLATLAQSDRASGSWIGPHDSAWSGAVPRIPGPESTSASGLDHSSHDSSRDDSDHTSAQPDRGGSTVPERRFIRVAADRLDQLMDMVGELIISRARVDAGLATISTLHREHEHRRTRISEIVDSFTEQAEYANLGSTARRKRVSGMGFGALEFDVYEEVHVFARRLAEATSDVSDTSTQMISGISQLGQRTEELGRIVSTLQSQINRARMVPLENVFTRLALAARDAAEREHKRVEVRTEGSDVVIDKAIADNLAAPLTHLIRNAVAHGIEPSAVRRASQKPEGGTISLTARQEAGEIIIEIADDGRGIDLSALRRAGITAGLIDAAISEDAPEVLDLVFAPGVSTSSTTTEVAGRGMGGDVVKKIVQRLGGTVRILNRPGAGVTFRLRLPVTLAITRAVLIRQAEQLFAIPMLFVERILPSDKVAIVENGAKLLHDKELLPIINVREGAPAKVFLQCAAGGRRLAIGAAEVLAHEEVVVKKLGYVLDGHPMFAGASQRGDGELALVLDMNGLLDRQTRAAKPMAQATAPILSSAIPLAPVRVRALFVDDSLSVRKVAEATLKRLGVDVVTANDGREALDRLREQPVSIVFTDLEMPRMHGYELIAEMRLLAAYRGIPIVVISSRSGDKHVKKALEAGANEYLTKPFTEERLGSVLATLVPGFKLEN